MSLSRKEAAKLVAEVLPRTRFVLGPEPEVLGMLLFHRLMEMDLSDAVDGVRLWACSEGYGLKVWWMDAVMELEAELRLAGDGWRWATDPPTTPRQVLTTDGDGAYWVAVYDAGTGEESGLEAGTAGCWGGCWVDAQSEVLEVAAWRELERWDGAEMPRWVVGRGGFGSRGGI